MNHLKNPVLIYDPDNQYENGYQSLINSFDIRCCKVSCYYFNQTSFLILNRQNTENPLYCG
jgi:hypothetical protein